MSDQDKVTKENPQHLNILVDKLKAEVVELTARKDNLNVQISDAGKRKEQTVKYDKAEVLDERNKLMREVAVLKSEVTARETAVKQHQSNLAQREVTVDKRAQEIHDARAVLNELQKERYEIFELRDTAQKMLNSAKRRMAQVTAFEGTKDEALKDIETKRTRAAALEKQWNDKIGKLEEDIKVYRRDRADLKARELALKKEVVNA